MLLALWSLFLLSFFAAVLGVGMRQKLELVRRLGNRDALSAAAGAGVRKALAAVKAEGEKQYQRLGDSWSNDPSLYHDIKVGDSVVNLLHRVGSGDGAVLMYGMTDEESKINLNTASEQVLERLFRFSGLDEGEAQNLANSIVDWRDKDEFLSVPLGSAESSYYRHLPLPYEAKNGDFEVLEEVLLVKGMDENLFQKIKEYITIYGNGAVNVNTAAKPVLVALGLSEETAGLVVEYRNGKDGVPGTEDDAVFTSPSRVASDLSLVYRLNSTELAELSNCVSAGAFGVVSQYFTVCAEASVRRGTETRTVSAVIDTAGVILNWTES